MAFPEAQRVIYEKNTLEEVKCEIRFPPILAIDGTLPANFQEAVRDEFPYFEVKSSVKLPPGMPAELTKFVEKDISLIGNKSYIFTSEDHSWVLSLGKDRLSLNCRHYERWEGFRERLSRALESLAAIYRPSFFTHTCLRYKNAVRREQLGLESTPWSTLLQPWVSGAFKSEVTNEIEAFQTKCVIRLPEDCGRVEATFSLGVHQPSNEKAFIIEAHVYNDTRKVLNDVLSRLDVLHGQARLFFRWCITDDLHRAMRPTSI